MYTNDIHVHIHVLIRDEKEGRNKQARSNKQQGKATQHTQGSHVHVLMRDERRKEETSKQGQTTNKAKQYSTPKAVTFPKNNELPRVRHVYT